MSKKELKENLGQEKNANLEKELESLRDKNLRLMAELQNQEKKHREEITETIKYGNKKLLQQFLFFPDNYERAQQVIQQIEKDPNQDINILQQKLKDLFQGLQMILV